jgi:hypothetical protein
VCYLLELFEHWSAASLTKLALSCNLPDCFALRALYVYWAKLPRLQHFENDRPVDGAGFKAASRVRGKLNDAPAAGISAATAAIASNDGGAAPPAVASVPFASLTHLRVHLRSGNFKYLARAAPSLRELDITADAGVRAKLADLAPLTALRELVVRYNGDVGACPLTPRNVAGLQQLHELRMLCIVAGATGASDERPLTDDDFGCLAAALPHLEHLAIRIGAGAPALTGAALRSLGQHCRQLQFLDISGTWDLTCWRESNVTPLFPQLTHLKLWQVEQTDTGTRG